ncbi:MAG: acyl carrier protein [Desulfovibrio sp.]
MRAKLFEIIAQVMSEDVGNISEESSPKNIEKWESLTHMNLILAIEAAFDLVFTDAEIVRMVDTKEILGVMEQKNV